jgi:hypothetical protein
MACLGEEVADGDRSDAKAALEVFQREVGRSLASLRKAVQP